MGMVLNHPSRTPPPRANRQHPERDTAVRWRAVPPDVVRKGEGGLLLVPRHFMLDSNGNQLDSGLVESLIQRIALLEKSQSDLRREMSVLLGRAAPVEESDRPMKPTAKAKEQVSKAVIAVSQPGNEAETLTVSDVIPAAKAETVLLLPAPSLKVVEPPVQKAANDEGSPDYADWLRSQFSWSDVEMFRVLDREFQRRNKACLKTHGKSYNDVRLERALKKQHMYEPGSHMYWAAEGPGIKEWEAHRSGQPTQLSVHAYLKVYERDAHRAWKRGMAFTPDAYAKRKQRAANVRKLDIAARLDGVRFMREMKRAQLEATAVAHAPNLAALRTSASQIKSWTLNVRDVADRVRRAVGLGVPDRGAKVREQAEIEGSVWDSFNRIFERKPKDNSGAPSLPNPANFVIEEALKDRPDKVPMRELVRGYRQLGIGH